jgi:hypothetical protein
MDFGGLEAWFKQAQGPEFEPQCCQPPPNSPLQEKKKKAKVYCLSKQVFCHLMLVFLDPTLQI